MRSRTQTVNLMRQLLDLCKDVSVDMISMADSEGTASMIEMRRHGIISETTKHEALESRVLVRINYTPRHDSLERQEEGGHIDELLQTAIRISLP